jgi:SulP family sulfate permease
VREQRRHREHHHQQERRRQRGGERRARARRWRGGQLYLQGLRQAAEVVLRNGGFLQEIGPEAVFRDKREAIAKVFERLDPGICARCKARIFEECATRPLRETPTPE